MATELGPLHPTHLDRLGQATHDALRFVIRNWVPVSVSTVVAAGLAGGYFLLSHGISQTAPVDNAPYSDTLPPPPEPPSPDKGPAVSVVVPPSVDTKPSTQPGSSTDKPPTTGGEVKQPAEWEKSYVMISAEEAQRLLDANPGSMIFPVDPRNAPNLKVENVSFQMPGGPSTVIGIKNIPVGENVSSVVPGNAKVSMSVGGVTGLAVAATVDSGGIHYTILARRENVEPQLDPNNKQGVGVVLGTSLFKVGNEQPLGFYPGEQQLIVESYTDSAQTYQNSVDQFLKVGGKRVFVGEPQK